MNEYTIRGGEEGKARLAILARELQASTVSLLKRAGIKEGMTCLDVGCGGGDVTLDIARLVGASGKAIGVDIDEVKLDLARQDAARQRLDQVEFRVGDVRELQEHKSCDMVYARFVLAHLRNPAEAVERMTQAIKPGGVLVIEDGELAAMFCYPPSTAFARYRECQQGIMQRRGVDPNIGPRLPELLRAAALQNVQIDLVQKIHMEGDGKRAHAITMQAVSEAVLAEGLASPLEIEEIILELERLARDSETIMAFPRVFQAWGYHR